MKSVYEKSNGITTFHLARLGKMQATKLLNCDTDRAKREALGNELLKFLCNRCNIDVVQMRLYNKPRPHTKVSEEHGHYQFNGHSQSIHIYNLTAKRQQPISIKSFFDTLVHEFMHHYDLHYLKLGDTLHTAGFYCRISDLKNKLTK